MSAKDLLEGIGSEDGSSTVRYYTSPPGSTFFAPLDDILEHYDQKASSDSTLNRGDIVELQGPAAAGKTQALQFFAMTTCLPGFWTVALTVRGSSRPPRTEKIAIGGRQKCAIVIDCDGRFDLARSYQLVRAHLQRRVHEHAATIPALYSATAEPNELHEEAMKALTRVHVFAPNSALSLTATLLQLPVYIKKSCSDEVMFLLLDNVSASYWQDRYQGEQSNLPEASQQNSAAMLRAVLSGLNQVRKQFGFVTVLSNWALASYAEPERHSPFFRQHLPRPYPSPFVTPSAGQAITIGQKFDPSKPLSEFFQITHHMTLHHQQVKYVSKDVTEDSAHREEPFRSMDQQEIGSMVHVRLPNVEGGDQLGRWELVIRENVIDGL